MLAATAPRGPRTDSGHAARLHRLLGHLLVVPTAVWTLAFFVLPLGLVTVFSFGTENLITFNVSFGWTASNYAAFGSALYLSTLLRSVALSLGTTAACAFLGFPLAFFISSQRPQVDRRRHGLLVPAAHGAADLCRARADQPGPLCGRRRPGRAPVAAVQAGCVPAGAPGPDRRRHHRRRPGDGRVR